MEFCFYDVLEKRRGLIEIWMIEVAEEVDFYLSALSLKSYVSTAVNTIDITAYSTKDLMQFPFRLKAIAIDIA